MKKLFCTKFLFYVFTILLMNLGMGESGGQIMPASAQEPDARIMREGQDGQLPVKPPRITIPQEYANSVQIVGRKAYLVGGEGKTGNSVRYDGSMIWEGPGLATVVVDEEVNAGTVVGVIRTQGYTYTIVMNQFMEHGPYTDGGIAKNLFLHGTTGQGPPIFPKVWTHLAGWGKATVYKDGKPMYEDFGAHFMLTQGVRNEQTHTVEFPSPEDVKKVIKAKKMNGGEEVKEEVKEIKEKITDAQKFVNPHTMQLHIVAHSPEKNPNNLPPFEKFIHFMFDETIWF